MKKTEAPESHTRPGRATKLNQHSRGQVLYFKSGHWVKRCPQCRKEFSTRTKQALYCSGNCRRKSEASAKAVSTWISQQLITRCGNEKCRRQFVPVNHAHRFCSPKCRSSAWRHQGDLQAPTPCAWCGTAFSPVRVSHRYCTTHCRKTAHRALTNSQKERNS